MSKEDSKSNLAIVESKEKSKGFVTIERTVLDLDIINDREKSLELLKVLAKGKLAKEKTPEELMSMYVKSRELGIGFASAADHMHIVNGKTGVDIHIIKALLLKAGSGIWWEKIKDYEPQYKYTDGSNVWIKGDSSDPNKFLPIECMYVYDKASNKKAEDEGKHKVWKDGVMPIDWITTYIFHREIKTKYSDEVKIITETSSFGWLEAIVAKLPLNKDGQLDPSSAWQKYKKLMIDHRAFTSGARAVGADLLMGVYETKELFDMNNISYTVDADAQVIN